MNKDNQERVDAYLRGEMNAKERAQFESDIKNDPALHGVYLETKAIADALADRQEKLSLMARWDEEENLKIKAEGRRWRMRRWAIGLSAAACIAAGFMIFKPLYYYDRQDAIGSVSLQKSANVNHRMPEFTETEEPVYYSFSSRDEGLPGADASLKLLDSMISSRQYEDALTIADSMISGANSDLDSYECLDSLPERDQQKILKIEAYIEDLEWRKANMLLAMREMEEAASLLKEIASKDGHYSVQADSLLNVIKEN